MFADLAEQHAERRGLAVRLQCIGVGPLFDEHERVAGLVQRVQLAAGFLVDCFDGLGAGGTHRIDGLRLGG